MEPVVSTGNLTQPLAERMPESSTTVSEYIGYEKTSLERTSQGNTYSVSQRCRHWKMFDVALAKAKLQPSTLLQRFHRARPCKSESALPHYPSEGLKRKPMPAMETRSLEWSVRQPLPAVQNDGGL